MAISIPIKNDPNHTIVIELDNKIYKLGFLYNTKATFWSITLWDENDNLLLSNIKIVANYPLIFPYKNANLPTGDFICQISDKTASITRDSFSLLKANLLYLTQEEIETI